MIRHAEPAGRTYVEFMKMNSFPGPDDTSERQEDTMNWSMYTADRTTHLKIVVVALVAGTLISSFGIAMRGIDLGTDIVTMQAPTVIKAGGPVVITAREATIIR